MTPLFLYLDCETTPAQDPDVRAEIDAKHTAAMPDLDAIKPAANLKDPEKIEADIAKRRQQAKDDFVAALKKADEARETEWRKTALDGGKGHLACVSFAFGGYDIKNLRNESLDGQVLATPKHLPATERGEYWLLKALFATLTASRQIEIAEADAEAEFDRKAAKAGSDGFYDLGGGYVRAVPKDRDEWIARTAKAYAKRTPILIAHNADFDIRFIWQRAMILGVQIPEWWPINFNKYRDDQVQDTMTMWAGVGNRISLDRLCKALGIPGKGDGLDGSKVWDAIVAGKLDDVCFYCDDDVERVRQIHRKLTGMAQSDGRIAVVAGEDLEAGDIVGFADDGKTYRTFPDLPVYESHEFSERERRMIQEFDRLVEAEQRGDV